ncbi:MAG TPA: hypothetical protein ENN80_15265 [Candidatus Hydrogenedentes bacterium]|nr:hypothetical protein [Candidatus Hydrogenedentota bacterium]
MNWQAQHTVFLVYFLVGAYWALSLWLFKRACADIAPEHYLHTNRAKLYQLFFGGVLMVVALKVASLFWKPRQEEDLFIVLWFIAVLPSIVLLSLLKDAYSHGVRIILAFPLVRLFRGDKGAHERTQAWIEDTENPRDYGMVVRRRARAVWLLGMINAFILHMLVMLVLASWLMLLAERFGWHEWLRTGAYGKGYAVGRDSCEKGELRLYELSERGEHRKTWAREGPFEIWNWRMYTTPWGVLYRPTNAYSRHFVAGYNKAMKRCAEQGGANLRYQPEVDPYRQYERDPELQRLQLELQIGIAIVAALCLLFCLQVLVKRYLRAEARAGRGVL